MGPYFLTTLYALLTTLYTLLLLLHASDFALGFISADPKCREKERQALLNFKQILIDVRDLVQIFRSSNPYFYKYVHIISCKD